MAECRGDARTWLPRCMDKNKLEGRTEGVSMWMSKCQDGWVLPWNQMCSQQWASGDGQPVAGQVASSSRISPEEEDQRWENKEDRKTGTWRPCVSSGCIRASLLRTTASYILFPVVKQDNFRWNNHTMGQNQQEANQAMLLQGNTGYFKSIMNQVHSGLRTW